MIGYKLFKLKKKYPGQLFPLYVMTDEPVPMHVWIPAKEGERTEDGKVKSRLGPLCFRPGWHLTEMPLATHIGIKEDGVIKYMHDDEVWCECEFSDTLDYQQTAHSKGWNNGAFYSRDAYLKYIPEKGFYRYKTNPQMLGEWIIAGEMKINRILSDKEVSEICSSRGYDSLPRKNQISLHEYGFVEEMERSSL